MEHKEIYTVKTGSNTHCTSEKYKKMYEESVKNTEEFWAENAQRIYWKEKWNKVKETSFNKPVSIKWFQGGKTNASYNCLDRHAEKIPNKTAIIWEADDPNEESKTFTYAQLHVEVQKFANILKNNGVKKGDRVTIYMPMIPEAAFAMLACSRIGAIHSVVFAGFSAESLAGRINDCQSDFVITSDEGLRGGKKIPLKKNVDDALEKAPGVRHVLVVKRTGADVTFKNGRDLWYHQELEKLTTETCEVEWMDAEDPLFILYTSGSTGQPKGLMHTTGGYLVYTSMTHKYVFDLQEDDVYWCTADVGWITGHSYIVYGPLANGATVLMHEGTPTYPDPSRHWQIIDKHQVTLYYTAPTAIRALMSEGEKFLNSTKRSTLRLLGSVGEPINPEAWRWYFENIGHGKCPIVDTWWQTETGGIMITPLPGATDQKPGSATRPFFGVKPVVVNDKAEVLEGAVTGHLCLVDSWPGQARTIYGDHNRFEQVYFSTYPGKYFTGDECRRDEDNYYWITGRADDVINVSGHRMGTAEVESALVAHEAVSEAAVVGFPHEIKGQGIFAYVTFYKDTHAGEGIVEELRQWVAKEIGAIAKPDQILITPVLPKTRSGKIMRRILRKIAHQEFDNFGDISTLADPAVVEALVEKRKNM